MGLRNQQERPSKEQVTFARNLRTSATDAESLLWYHLRGQHLGAKFRRQHPLGPYILDFVCIERGLVIEVDGSQHYSPQGMLQDEERIAFLEGRRLQVLRFSNVEVLTQTESVLEAIVGALSEPSP